MKTVRQKCTVRDLLKNMLIKMHQDKAVAVLCEHQIDTTVMPSTKSDSQQNQKESLVGNATVYPNDVVMEK